MRLPQADQRKLSQRVVTRGGACLRAFKANQHSPLDTLVTLFTLEPPPGETFTVARQQSRCGNLGGAARCNDSPLHPGLLSIGA